MGHGSYLILELIGGHVSSFTYAGDSRRSGDSRRLNGSVATHRWPFPRRWNARWSRRKAWWPRGRRRPSSALPPSSPPPRRSVPTYCLLSPPTHLVISFKLNVRSVASRLPPAQVPFTQGRSVGSHGRWSKGLCRFSSHSWRSCRVGPSPRPASRALLCSGPTHDGRRARSLQRGGAARSAASRAGGGVVISCSWHWRHLRLDREAALCCVVAAPTAAAALTATIRFVPPSALALIPAMPPTPPFHATQQLAQQT